MIALIKRVVFDGLLFITNRLVAHVPSHTFRLLYYKLVLRLEIADSSFIFMDAWFHGRGRFRMGHNSVINERCRLDNRGGISIGNNVSISAETCIITAQHDVQSREFGGSEKAVSIDDYAFVGTRAMILPGVRIGKGAVIAAGAVVTSDVEPYTVVAGVPARPIGKRRSDLDYELRYCRLFA
jgi:acetyltransferase-like isoleucine patch superfamily enzyme